MLDAKLVYQLLLLETCQVNYMTFTNKHPYLLALVYASSAGLLFSCITLVAFGLSARAEQEPKWFLQLLKGTLPVEMVVAVETRNATITSKQVETKLSGTVAFHPVLRSQDTEEGSKTSITCRMTFVVSSVSTSGAKSEEASQSSEFTAQVQGLTSEFKYFPENGTVDTEGMQIYNGTELTVNEAVAKLHAQLAVSLYQFRCGCKLSQFAVESTVIRV